MGRVQGYKCEVCGIQEIDHSNWLLVSDQPRAHNIDIHKWDDKLAAQPGICHLCCSDHMQVLVSTWMMPDLGIPPQVDEPAERDDRLSVLSAFNLNRACNGLETDRETLLAALDAFELAMRGSKSEDETPSQIFDA